MPDTSADIRQIHEAMIMLFGRVEHLSVVSEATLIALSAVIDTNRPSDPDKAIAWLNRMRDVAIGNVQMRSFVEREEAAIEGTITAESAAAAEDRERQLVETLWAFFDGMAKPAGEIP